MGATKSDKSGVDYRRQAWESARRTIPPTMRWAGGLVVAVAVVNEVIPPPTAPQFFVTLAVFGGVIFALGSWMRDQRVPGWIIPWVYTFAVIMLVTGIMLMYVNRPVGWDFLYVGVIIAGFAPLAFGWAPFFVGGGYTFVASVVTLRHTNTVNSIDWEVGVLAAIAIGGMMLGQRLQLVREIADAEFARDQLVETDALTNLFNRRGVHSRIETLWAGAMRRGEAVTISFVDIVGLKRANDAFGHELGDRIIVEVAHAIRESVRREDLVARWGGDEFVVLAKGEVTPAELLQQRILANLRMRDAAFDGRWHSNVTVGVASAAPDGLGFQELLERADADMYARRQRARDE